MTDTAVAGSAASSCWAAVLEACSPDATKSLLIGEFTTAAPDGYDGPGVTVDWTTIKEIQAAILEQVKINMGFRCEYCGNADHILTLRDRGKRSCCGKRWMMPPNTRIDGATPHNQGNDKPACPAKEDK